LRECERKLKKEEESNELLRKSMIEESKSSKKLAIGLAYLTEKHNGKNRNADIIRSTNQEERSKYESNKYSRNSNVQPKVFSTFISRILFLVLIYLFKKTPIQVIKI